MEKSFSGKKAFLVAAIGFAVGIAFGTYMASGLDEGYGDTGDHLGTGTAFGNGVSEGD